MPVQVSIIMIGVEDMARSKRFYQEGLGCKLEHDFPNFASFDLGDGSSSLALYGWRALAADAGVSPEGSGFRGFSLNYIVASREAAAAPARRVPPGRPSQAAAEPLGGVAPLNITSTPDGSELLFTQTGSNARRPKQTGWRCSINSTTQ